MGSCPPASLGILANPLEDLFRLIKRSIFTCGESTPVSPYGILFVFLQIPISSAHRIR